MVDAAYGNDQLKGICEGDSIPSTRTSNPGPGSNVKSSFKKQKFEFDFPEIRFLRNTSFCHTANIQRYEERPKRRDRWDDRSFEIWEILTQIFPDTRNRTEIPEKPWKSSRYSMESSFQKQEFPNSGKRPPWKKDYKLSLIMFSYCWQFRCYVDGEHSMASLEA